MSQVRECVYAARCTHNYHPRGHGEHRRDADQYLQPMPLAQFSLKLLQYTLVCFHISSVYINKSLSLIAIISAGVGSYKWVSTREEHSDVCILADDRSNEIVVWKYHCDNFQPVSMVSSGVLSVLKQLLGADCINSVTVVGVKSVRSSY